MKNAELEDIDYIVNRYIFHDNLDINGNIFEDVYTVDLVKLVDTTKAKFR